MVQELIEIEQSAIKLLEQGSLIQAKKLLEELVKKNYSPANLLLKKTASLLCRRLWLKGKEEFLKEAISDECSLAKARFQGAASLQAFAQSNHKDAFLAKASCEPSVKKGLLILRQIPEFVHYAEGWLSLIKKDLEKAKLSFQKALEQQPKRARIALAIIAKYEGNFLENANTCHIPSLPKEQFPLTFELLTSQEEITVQEISHLFFHATVDVLKILLTKLQPAQKKEKGLINLRLGDLQFAALGMKQQASEDILSYWNLAVKLYPQLKLDFLKRMFLFYAKNQEKELCHQTLQEIYFFLEKKNKELANSFLEVMIFHNQDFDGNYFASAFLGKNATKWNQSFPSNAARLLCLEVFLENLPEVHRIPLPREHQFPITGESLHLESLPFLDQVYLKNEKYLTLKNRLLCLTNKIHDLRKSLAYFLDLFPHAKQELLPQYLELALSTIQEKSQIENEVARLQSIFPTDYDLARVRLLLFSAEELFPYYQNHYSQQLMTTLKLQHALDKKDIQESLILSKQALLLYGQDHEANWRFWHALIIGSEIFTPKFLSSVFAIAQHSDLEKIFKMIFNYKETIFSENFIKIWKKECKNSWMPYYHHCLLGLKTHDQDAWHKALLKFIEHCPPSHEEAYRFSLLLSLSEKVWKD